ncbi:MAG: hypothetical protein LQ345_006025 [Seirophora villosa]|nr:MAG: hypothetical protein LQ345_006025 [Seirophora villosa]
MASALTANLYSGQPPVFARTPRHPPSPPVEDFHSKCTLPSIQSLIGVMADSPPAEAGQQGRPSISTDAYKLGLRLSKWQQERNGGLLPLHYQANKILPQRTMPRHMSPSATSSRSSATPAGPYYNSAKSGSNVDPQLERQPPPPASHAGHGSMPPASDSPYQSSPYPPSPSNPVTYPYPLPAQAVTAPPPMYYQQRPLPTNFPPPPPPPPSGPMDPAMTNSQQQQSPSDQGSPWQHQHQHHHYISPSSSAALSGQPQDRYVCQTCNKAFSRPSSLRIHCHSHTGEKPFKCPHPGCGKAFSVRSNMKRHERGCHGGSSPADS